MAFRPLLDHLQHLTLSFEGDDTVDSEDSEDSEDSDEEELTFPLIGEVLDEVGKLPGLKELNFDALPDLHQLPVIPQLRRLEVLQYTKLHETNLSHLRNLQFLKLEDCSEISDVRCLDHIYELHLINCSSVTDISGLNHNSVINIDSCPIRDCNGSFQFSRVIRLCDYSGERMNLDPLERVQSLTIEDYDPPDRLLRPNPLFISREFPSSLTYLKLRNMAVPFTLPHDHRLRELVIEYCYQFSLKNLENIPVIKITANADRNLSALNNRSKVEISYCSMFESGEALNNVKELIVTVAHVSQILDLRHITHLIFFSSPGLPDRRFTNSVLPTATHLQEIQLRVKPTSLNSYDKVILKALKKYPSIKRIVIIQESDFKFEKEVFQVLDALLGDDFNIEHVLSGQIVLLRKDNHEGKNKYEGSSFTMKGLLAFLIIPLIASLFYTKRWIDASH